MLRSKATLLATAAALAATVSGGITAANADTTGASGATGATGTTGTTGATGTTAPAATITINGAGYATVDSNAPTATMQSDYLGALESALGDAHAKAAALAADAGDTLGPVENITEQSNDSYGCSGPVAFGRASSSVRPPSPAGPAGKKHHRHRKAVKPTVARIADETPSSCTVEADVTVTYALSAA
jgi:hypothetical protein